MNCVCCGGNIEYRPKDTIYQNPEDEFICGLCLDICNEADDFEIDYDYQPIDVFINNSITPPRFLD